MFCFARKYLVDTVKNGQRSVFAVGRAVAGGPSPFTIGQRTAEKSLVRHGTTLSAVVESAPMATAEIAPLIGSRFVADPEFRIFVNGGEITLTHLEDRCEIHRVTVPGAGELVIRRYDNEQTGRTSRQCGVAWWVNRRLVGTPSWDVLDGPLLDARGVVGRRFTYVIEADCLAGPDSLPWVKDDWSGFHTNAQVSGARRAVNDFVRDDLRGLLADLRRERKRGALENTRPVLQQLSVVSQEHVARFTEEVLRQSPTISERDLENAVQVLATLEKSRTGYQLLEKLAQLSPNDMDGLDAILDEWSVSDARKVLDELRYRLRLIKELEGLVDKHTTDELHDLQPLFARGLWIFGPEFEAVSFTSNRTLATVVQEFFGHVDVPLQSPRRRPDFVVLPDASIGVYSAEAFDERHEVSGLARVVILELKRGGFEIGDGEKSQALNYAKELRRSGRVSKDTPITCYVLGSTVDSFAEDTLSDSNITVLPRRYQAILGQAHARTFRLLSAIENSKAVRIADAELADVLDVEAQAQHDLPLSSVGVSAPETAPLRPPGTPMPAQRA